MTDESLIPSTKYTDEIKTWVYRGLVGLLLALTVFFATSKLSSIETGINSVAIEQKIQSVEQQSQKTDIAVIKHDVGSLGASVETLRKSDTETQQRLYDLQLRVPQRRVQ